MLDRLTLEPPDPLLALIGLFRADARPSKIDLGVGVYRNAEGFTPVMRSVKAAERELLEGQATKAYVGASGDLAFIDLMASLVLGQGVDPDRLAAIQTPGGTGALRLGADILARAGAGDVLVGRPTWANHDPILRGAGLRAVDYPYFDMPTQTVLFRDIVEALSNAAQGSVVLLQASCHNPTGGDLTEEQWALVAAIVRRRRLVPFIDVAYQGFGHGLAEDVAGARIVLASAKDALVAVSCSKSFGLYRERTGVLFAICGSVADRAATQSNMQAIARANYSMPPDHGAAIVRIILQSDKLRADWEAELAEARARIQGMRRALGAQAKAAGLGLSALSSQGGMFSQLSLTEDQIGRLRDEHGLYVTGSGRINVAGLQVDDIPAVVAALRAVVPLRACSTQRMT